MIKQYNYKAVLAIVLGFTSVMVQAVTKQQPTTSNNSTTWLNADIFIDSSLDKGYNFAEYANGWQPVGSKSKTLTNYAPLTFEISIQNIATKKWTFVEIEDLNTDCTVNYSAGSSSGTTSVPGVEYQVTVRSATVAPIGQGLAVLAPPIEICGTPNYLRINFGAVVYNTMPILITTGGAAGVYAATYQLYGYGI